MNNCYECKHLIKLDNGWMGLLKRCNKDLRKRIPFLHPCKDFEKVETK